MTIFKVQGVVEERRGYGARIRVISFKKQGRHVNELSEIKNQFPPYGFIWANRFFENHPFEIFSLIECSAVPLEYKTVDDGDDYQMYHPNECKTTGTKLLNAPSNFLFADKSINQAALKEVIQEDIGSFYFAYESKIFGPFRVNHGEVIPKKGMEVNVYNSHPQHAFIYSIENSAYVISISGEPLYKCDCMTQSQLADWLRSHIKNSLPNTDFGPFKRVIELLQTDDINLARADKALKTMDQLGLVMSEIKAITNISSVCAEKFDKSLIGLRSELVQNMVEPFEQQKNKLESEIIKLANQKTTLLEEIDLTGKKLTEATESYKYITENRKKIIDDFRVQVDIGQNLGMPRTFLTYERQDYDSFGHESTSLSDLISQLNETFQNLHYKGNYLGQKIIEQLTYKKCILTDNIPIVQYLANITGNCTIFLQQVEGDWLKFECFYRNGLADIWNEAVGNPERLFFLLLQDINLASIECYARPINDLLAGIRVKLPGAYSKWPQNLWIIGSPVNEQESPGLGLPLSSEWFAHWGSFPKNLPKPSNTLLEPPSKKIQIDSIINYPSNLLTVSNDFFL